MAIISRTLTSGGRKGSILLLLRPRCSVSFEILRVLCGKLARDITAYHRNRTNVETRRDTCVAFTFQFREARRK